MLATQTSFFNIAAAKAVALTIRETNSYQRIFYFRNHSASTLSIWIESSADGGETWAVVGASFNLGPDGDGSEVAVKDIDVGSEILRIQVSGGSDYYDKELEITFARYYLDSDNPVWTKPAI